MKKILMAAMITLSISNVQAEGISDKLRPYVEQFLGDEIAVKLFGSKEESIKLPEIPKVNKDAKSTRAEYVDKVKTNITKEQMNKANLSFLFEVYEAARRVKPNDNDVAKWMNVITQGGSREGVYRALVLDNTYAAMENYDTPMTDSGIAFAKYYVATFISKEISKDSLEKTNFFTLKRVLVEQTLEILDELLFKDVNLFYDWYAVFSADTAKKYPAFFTNKIRKSTSRERHRKWAQFVPIQHVKSEVIIKLHKLFNATNQ
ncbi:hypothetical protein [Halobacteriovorax sp. JY17]|uniref:hypothetical protein n=1 Tax=Halobacteriovorax sp. JY17 TaxID=2014617 RepID=UPI000C41FBDC|nr:hypothetical protein [Halobacteriovorax sp. JY17]PIK14088.1 MAG: hypothetical protein CES88_13985 [Halobacteriovorax sp. JY17]